jgi:hypothetical protein
MEAVEERPLRGVDAADRRAEPRPGRAYVQALQSGACAARHAVPSPPGDPRLAHAARALCLLSRCLCRHAGVHCPPRRSSNELVAPATSRCLSRRSLRPRFGRLFLLRLLSLQGRPALAFLVLGSRFRGAGGRRASASGDESRNWRRLPPRAVTQSWVGGQHLCLGAAAHIPTAVDKTVNTRV